MLLSPLLLSFQVAIVATLLATILGVALGAALSQRKLPARNLLDALLTAPMVLPPTVLGYYLLLAVGRRSMLGAAFETVTGSPLVFTRSGAIMAAAIGGLPMVVKAARSSLETIAPDLLDVARTLGASRTRIFLTIELPLARRGIAGGVMLAFARALGDFGVTLMVAGNIPGETQTASLAIYDAVQAGRDGDALGMALVLTAIAVVLLYAVTTLAERGAT